MDAHLVNDPTQELAQWVEALGHPDPAARLDAARVLGEAGKPGIAAILVALRDADVKHKETLVRTLVLLGATDRVQELRSDPEFVLLAEESLAAILRREPDWNRWVESVGPWFLLVAVLLGVGNELLAWLGFITFARGVSQQIAVGWALIGAFGGAVCGARWGRPGLFSGAKQLGVLGALAGAAIGKLLADLLTPIILALGG